MSWKSIARNGSPQVLGRDPQASGLLEVEITLSDVPPDEWRQAFLSPVGISISLSMHPPRISGDTVKIRPPDHELESYVKHVDERIGAANKWFEQNVLPQQQAAAAREKDLQSAEQKRIADAKARAEKL